MNKSPTPEDSEIVYLLYGQIAEEIESAAAGNREADFSSLLDAHCDSRDRIEQMISVIQLIYSIGKNAKTTDVSAHFDQLQERQQLGDYRIIKEIGRGGMGVVYQAKQLSLDRTVALKVLPMAAFLDNRQLRRFKNEARAAASLQHPGIVRIHGVGCDRSIHFYAMDLIDGSDLADAIREIHRTPLAAKYTRKSQRFADNAAEDTMTVATLATQQNNSKHEFYRSVARIGIQAAEALQYAHDEGIIHRDVKPANLLLDERGFVHITDFGLAQVQSQDNLTLTGNLVGTMRYMSLEQVEGNRSVDSRTDIYSLGLTLYELVSGVPPFSAKSKARLLREIAESSPKRLDKLVPGVPRDLATIIEKSIAKEADDRYRAARDLASDLTAFIDSRSIRARPSTQFDRVRRFTKRNPILAAALVTTLLSLSLLSIVSVVLAVVFANQTKHEARRVAHSKVIERTQRIGLYARDMHAAQSLAESRRLVELQEALLEWVPDNDEEDLRDFEWFHLWQYCDGTAIIRAFDHELPMDQVEFLDNHRIVTSGFANRAKIWSFHPGVQRSSPKFLQLPSIYIDGLTFHSKTGRLAAGDDDGNVTIWNPDLPSGKRVVFTSKIEGNGGSTDDVRCTAFNSAGTQLAVAGGSLAGGFVHVWELDRPQPLFKHTVPSGASVVFDHQDDLVVGHYESGEVEVYDSMTWHRKATVQLEADGVIAMDGSDDRTLVAAATHRTHNDEQSWRVELWDATSLVRFSTFGATSRPCCVDLSADGTILTWGDESGTAWLVRVAPSNDAVRVGVRAKLHPLRIRDVAISPDKAKLATASTDGFTTVWDIAKVTHRSGGPVIDYSDRDFLACTSCLLPGSRGHVALAIRGEGLAIWDSHSGNVEVKLPIANHTENLITVIPDSVRNSLVVGFGCWPAPDDVDAKNRILFGNPRSSDLEEVWIPAFAQGMAAMSLSRNGRWLAVSTHHHGVVVLDRTTKMQLLLDLNAKAVAFTPDSHTLIVGDRSGVAHFRQAPHFDVGTTIRLDDRLIESIDASWDNRLVAAVGFDHKIVILNRENR